MPIIWTSTFFFLCLQGRYYPMEMLVKSDHLQVQGAHCVTRTHAAVALTGLRNMQGQAMVPAARASMVECQGTGNNNPVISGFYKSCGLSILRRAGGHQAELFSARIDRFPF